MQTQHQSERITDAHREPAQISGRTWFVTGNAAKCAYPACQPPPREAQVTAPHPTKHGWRIAWVFLGGLVALFTASPWIAKAMGWCAVLVIPYWVAR